jgi:hypothetical protein
VAPNSHWIGDENHFEELVSRRFDDGGPVLLAAKIDDEPGTARTVRDPRRSSVIASCAGLASHGSARSTHSDAIRMRIFLRRDSNRPW